jgi:phosphopantetheinyl transferase (holo-ACP synthase)
MEKPPENSTHTDLIRKEEFIRLFSSVEHPENWFTVNELEKFSMERNARSLAARYLVKKRICDHLGNHDTRMDMEILNDPYGKPEIRMGKAIRALLDKAGIRSVLCSLSHSRNFITGMTVFINHEA